MWVGLVVSRVPGRDSMNEMNLREDLRSLTHEVAEMGKTVVRVETLLGEMSKLCPQHSERLRFLESRRGFNGDAWKVWAIVIAALAGGGNAALTALKTVIAR